MRTLAALALLSTAASAATQVSLRSETRVAGGYVALEDVATVTGEGLPRVWFGRAPVAGEERLVTAEEVKTELRKAGVSLRSVSFQGASTCVVRCASETELPGLDGWRAVAGRAIAEAAQAAVPGARVSCQVIEVTGAAEETDFAAVTIVKVKPADGWWLGEARFHIYVNIGEADSAVWTVRAVSRGTRRAVVARRPMRAGHRVASTDVAIGEAPALLENGIEETSFAVGRILAADVAEGSAVTSGDLKPGPLVLRGDAVTVSSAGGAVTVKRTVVALEDGCVGDVIRAKNPDSKKELRLRVTGPGAGDAVEE